MQSPYDAHMQYLGLAKLLNQHLHFLVGSLMALALTLALGKLATRTKEQLEAEVAVSFFWPLVDQA